MRKFKIPTTPKSSTKTIRFPDEVIERIESKIADQDCSFSKFVIEACKTVLEDLDSVDNG
ncbi:hypothetical protein D3C76_1388730 [compost metagenome]